ncbi:MAG: cysteine synthase family protein [Paracoccaceae bacterium]|nr:cysteine synthase family protein [Paracoccaceae bacterium]
MNALESFRRREGVLASVTEAMAATPLVALDRLTAGVDGRILAKLDYLLPGFSKKDRAALRIIENAERAGELAPGQTVVELTSGNMGTGLAIVCGVKGYPFVAVMSRGNSAERARMMRALGAEVVLVDQAPVSRPGEVSGADLALVEEAAQRITAERGAFRADQFQRPGNPEAHRDGTGPEIWLQSGGQIDAFCDFVGSAGTLAGCAAFFRTSAPQVKCYAVEPEGAEALAGCEMTRPDHPIQGGGYSMAQLDHLEDVALDGYLKVSGAQARDAARRLAREEGIFAGYSAGANLAAALQLLAGPHRGGTVAVIICDSGLKYLSTDLWTEDAP